MPSGCSKIDEWECVWWTTLTRCLTVGKMSSSTERGWLKSRSSMELERKVSACSANKRTMFLKFPPNKGDSSYPPFWTLPIKTFNNSENVLFCGVHFFLSSISVFQSKTWEKKNQKSITLSQSIWTLKKETYLSLWSFCLLLQGKLVMWLFFPIYYNHPSRLMAWMQSKPYFWGLIWNHHSYILLPH